MRMSPGETDNPEAIKTKCVQITALNGCYRYYTVIANNLTFHVVLIACNLFIFSTYGVDLKPRPTYVSSFR